jgi:DNA repair exonuclease SbcCD ATPase subunit
MRNLFILVAIISLTVACKEDPKVVQTDDTGDSKEVIELRNKVQQLELENTMKDSVLNEAISFFNEVQANLAKINIKEEEIRVRSSNPEISSEDQEWILQEIQNINFLREQNARKIRNLQGQIKNQTLRIKELENMVDRLVLQIQSRDEQIASLKRTLADVDMEYAELFDEYQEQVELALDVMKEMNTVHYSYGTLDELVNNGVLVREGGFIGIGRKTTIADDMNEDYFQHLDKTKTKQITIVGEDPEIITDHPVSTYEWKGNKLVILDAEKFWRISNYLVVTVK